MYIHISDHKTIVVRNSKDSNINESVNVLRRTTRGILRLCSEPLVVGVRDSWKFYSPDITSVKVSVLTASPTAFTTTELRPRACGTKTFSIVANVKRMTTGYATTRTAKSVTLYRPPLYERPRAIWKRTDANQQKIPSAARDQ